MLKQYYTYYDGDAVLEAYVVYDTASLASTLPAVLICHDWTGRNAFAEKTADTMASLGYVGFALDVYGNGRQGVTNDEKMQLMTPFMQHRDKLLIRLLAAVDAVQSFPIVDPHRIAVIGYCFGGLCALDLARGGANLRGAVSFHGMLVPPAPPFIMSKALKTKILALHGYDDPMVTPQHVLDFAQEMTQSQADWQLHMYGNTKHAFTNPLAHDPVLGTEYSEVAAKRSMSAMQHFLKEIFTL